MATGTSSPRAAEPVSRGPDGGDANVLTVRDALRRVRGMRSPYAGGRLLSDELIEERRREEERSWR